MSKPGSPKKPRPPKKKGMGEKAIIFAAVITGVAGIVAAIVYVVLPQFIHQPSTPTSTVPPISTYVTSPPSSPAYAHVLVALHSGSPSASNQETLVLDFKNTGTSDCTDIKFSAVNLISTDGNKVKPSSPIDKSWTLLASGMTVQRNVTFPIALVKGAKYNL